MRKQTKLVAVASAAALMAIGASMTSFAATGWVYEDGQWFFYDADENRVEDEWKKSGDNWYWLSSEEGGAMAVDTLVEDDDDTYYVDGEGVMVRNTWVKVVNEDQDDEEDPAEYHWYYMGSNGKAYKNTSNEYKYKSIDGKKYCFDEDGKMLYGWVNSDGTRETDESGWEDALYYLGSWEDGAVKTGWQKIYVHDADEDDDLEYWFNFQANGKKRADAKDKGINGRKYTFDHRGVMVSEWVLASGSVATTTDGWKYYNSPEDGARMTKGWFKVLAPKDDDNTFYDYTGSFAWKDADDESERWYYADGDGKLATGEIKHIGPRYYGFRENDGEKGGAMLTGLCLLQTDGKRITKTLEADMDADTLDDIINNDYKVDGVALADSDYADATLFYFGNDADTDGAMRTGATTISLDGDTFNFMFSKSGGAEGKGRGLTGIDDNKYIYNYGCRIKAGSDDKYRVVGVTANENGSTNINAKGVIVDKKDSAVYRDENAVTSYDNNDDENVSYNVLSGEEGEKLYLINSSGSIQKTKTAAKDGDDWFFYVKDREVKLYTSNKNLKNTTLEVSDWEDLLTLDAE